MGDLEGDTVSTSIPSCTLSKSDYGDVIAELCNNFVKKDIQKMRFLCSEFIKDKSFLERENLSAWDIFKEMNRNGSLSREKIGILSQLIYLIEKLKLQTTVLAPKGISPWRPGMQSYIDNFRLLLFNISQHMRKRDVEKMLEVCELRTILKSAEVEEVAGDPLRLFTGLIQKEVISENDLAFLKVLVDEVDDDSMRKMLHHYQDNFQEKSKKLLTNNKEVGKLETALKSIASLRISDSESLSAASGVSGKGADNSDTEEMSGPTPTLLRPVDLVMASNNKFQEELLKAGKCSEHLEKSETSSTPFVNESTDSPMPSNLDVHPGNPTTAKYNDANSSPAEEDAQYVIAESKKESLDEQEPPTSQKLNNSTQTAFEIKSFATSIGVSEEEECPGGTKQSESSISLPIAKSVVGAMNMTVRSENTQKQIDDIKLSSEDNEDSTYEQPIFFPVKRPIQRQDSGNHYSMTQIPRGYFLLLTYDKFDEDCHKERRGNDKDREKLKELCVKLKFEVHEAHNCTFEETEQLVKKMAKKEHKDCFICFVCSHGDGKHFITSDGGKYSIKDLISSFKPANCESLSGKPKIFFINSCLRETKGVKYQSYTEVANDEKQLDADGPESMGLTAKRSNLCPDDADFCICLSTVPGYSSARQPNLGTIYVQNVFKAFMKWYKTKQLADILLHINKSTDDQLKKRAEENKKDENSETFQICQVHPVITTLSKKLYFP